MFRKIDARDVVPVCTFLLCGDPLGMHREITPTMVSVFNPYRSIVGEKDGGERPVIRNRADHEAFLRRNGYEEVGNDKSMAPPHPEELAERAQSWRDAPDAPMVDVERLKREGFVQEDLI